MLDSRCRLGYFIVGRSALRTAGNEIEPTRGGTVCPWRSCRHGLAAAIRELPGLSHPLVYSGSLRLADDQTAQLHSQLASAGPSCRPRPASGGDDELPGFCRDGRHRRKNWRKELRDFPESDVGGLGRSRVVRAPRGEPIDAVGQPAKMKGVSLSLIPRRPSQGAGLVRELRAPKNLQLRCNASAVQ